MHFTHKIWIDIYPSTYPAWPVELLKLAGYLLSISSGDFVLESNGDTPYLMRKKKDRIVYVASLVASSSTNIVTLDKNICSYREIKSSYSPKNVKKVFDE